MASSLRQKTRLSRAPVGLVAAGAILVLAPFLLAFSQIIWLRWLAIMALAWYLPGALLLGIWRLQRIDLPEAIVLAAGLGLCWMILVAVLLHWLPGPLGLVALVAAYEVGAVALLAILLGRDPEPLQPVVGAAWAWLAVLLLLALLLRLPGLGYHEFHIDEVEVLRRARWAIDGVDEVLEVHTKGPGEIAVAMVAYRALGTAEEGALRLPFALMSVASVVATALLGRRLLSATTGFWAGVLLAANGFALALSRIVQYQPGVLLLSVLAIFSAWEFAQRSEVRWLALAVLFSAFGASLHYELVLLAPALIALTWAGWRRAPNRTRVLQIAVPTILAGALIVAVCYVPIMLNPHLTRIQRQLAARMDGVVSFSLPILVEQGTFYNSVYFFFGLVALVGAGIVLGWRRARWQIALLVLWFLPALLLYLFVIRYPGLHYYILMPAWSLLAALPLAELTERRTVPSLLRCVALGLVGLWLLVSAGYLYLAFFRQNPEYIANYETERLPMYPAPYGEAAPLQPRFGFPIREGWKTLGLLSRWGCLVGTYSTNEGARVHDQWYLRDLAYTDQTQAPDYVFQASHVQAPHANDDEGLLQGYQKVGEVRLRDEPRLAIWARVPFAVPYVTLRAEDHDALFDDLVPGLDARPGHSVQVLQEALCEALELQYVTVPQASLGRGDVLYLTLGWLPLKALEKDYKIFVHVTDETRRPLALWDGHPCLNMGRTSQWPAGSTITDPVVLVIPDDFSPGEYSLWVGVYDGESGQRLGDRAIEVGTIRVR